MTGRRGRRVQLHRAFSKLGWGSRGQAWAWIRAGEVCVDGRVVTDPLTWVDLDHQRITRNDREAPAIAGSLTLALHKPRGIVTTRRDERAEKPFTICYRRIYRGSSRPAGSTPIRKAC